MAEHTAQDRELFERPSPAVLRRHGYITETDAHVAVMAWDGLASPADLARRWGISRQRGWQLAREPDFPPPIGHVNCQPVYLVAEADEWRESRTSASVLLVHEERDLAEPAVEGA